ncbi:unnamed protein product [Phaedon cochleariae]|uniref:H15 domain-containing protein n=1 Tax=Phaedon cochleariae TaxID=80249 RepID=A0A9P0GRC8_PHACE|nr:unnamed protein product [Phaedon cochleariae]
MAKKMGGSQSKFKPEAQDAWLRVKISGKQPKYLQTVMQAIADLKDYNGSSESRVIEYIREIIDNKNPGSKPRNVTAQIKKALKHAVTKGLVRQRAGKFQLALNKKDFAIFKSFKVEDPLTDCGRCKKQKKRGKGRSRGRGKGRRSPKKHRSGPPHMKAQVDKRKNNLELKDHEEVPSNCSGSVGSEEHASSVDSFRGVEDDFSSTYLN